VVPAAQAADQQVGILMFSKFSFRYKDEMRFQFANWFIFRNIHMPEGKWSPLHKLQTNRWALYNNIGICLYIYNLYIYAIQKYANLQCESEIDSYKTSPRRSGPPCTNYRPTGRDHSTVSFF
jgi:hypothetical protein